MSRLVLVTGGARSGKSSYAAELAKRSGRATVFIATATCLDDEMKERVRLHKLSRPKEWHLIEEPEDPRRALCGLDGGCAIALIDCLGLWITNMLMAGLDDAAIKDRVEKLSVSIASAAPEMVIIVSNEVGCGIVPLDPLSRRFRDLIGSANQCMASRADEVVVMHSGIPLKIK